jgi:hypothetical protein
MASFPVINTLVAQAFTFLLILLIELDRRIGTDHRALQASDAIRLAIHFCEMISLGIELPGHPDDIPAACRYTQRASLAALNVYDDFESHRVRHVKTPFWANIGKYRSSLRPAPQLSNDKNAPSRSAGE